MERRLALQGRNTTEKLTHLERILANFQNRLSKTVVGIIPPIPFMVLVREPDMGMLANILIPVSGVIDMAFIRIGSYDSKPVTLEITIQSGSDKSIIEFECSRPAHSFEAKWNIKAGDLIQVYGEGVHNIHIAFALQPSLNRAVKETHMLEGFMAILEKGDNNGSTI